MTREKYSSFAEAIEQGLKEQEEEKYLQSLAKKYAVGENKNYNLARSIVLDIHITEELYVNSIIALLIACGGPHLDLNLDWKDVRDEIGNIDYVRKISIIRKMKIFSDKGIKIMMRLNNLRRAFAHGFKDDHSDYKYQGKSIFQKDTIELLISDHIKIITREALDFISGEKE